MLPVFVAGPAHCGDQRIRFDDFGAVVFECSQQAVEHCTWPAAIDASGPCEVVAGSGRHDAQRNRPAGNQVDRAAQCAVATVHEHGVDALIDCGSGLVELSCPVRGIGHDELDAHAAMRSHAANSRDCTAPVARGWIQQDEDAAHAGAFDVERGAPPFNPSPVRLANRFGDRSLAVVEPHRVADCGILIDDVHDHFCDVLA